MWKRLLRMAALGLALSLSLLSRPAFSASSFGWACGEYDEDIRASVDRWWPDLRIWKLWRAQIYQESRCDTNAVSPVGAAGLTQLMPNTSKDMARKLGIDPMTSPHMAKFAIPAGAAYMAQLRSVWRRDRQPIDAHWLAAASYNRGTGNILRDQAECFDARSWPEISPCTAKHTMETVIYVGRIDKYWNLMETQQ